MSTEQDQEPQASPPVTEKREDVVAHPRAGMPDLKWKGSMLAFTLIAGICGSFLTSLDLAMVNDRRV